MDIVTELRDSATRVLDGSGIMCEVRMELLTAAANEIEHLRSLAGAVSQGPSFAQITGMIAPSVILKAFDGA